MAPNTLEGACLLVAVGLFAGTVNTVAGGGSLITLPALMLLGLSPAVANASNRVGVLLQSAVACRSLTRNGWPPGLLPRAGVAGAGAALGAALALALDASTFRFVIAAVMVLMLAVLVFDPKRFLEPAPPKHLSWVLLGFFVAGLYGGFLQAGVGILLLAVGTLLAGEDLAQANTTKNVLVFLFTLPALAVFAAQGAVDWAAGGWLALGSAIGGGLGARLVKTKGARFVRWVLVASVLAGVLRLIWNG